MLPVSPTDRIFILAGAGVSAESGIPTFRGVDGLWRNYRIEEVASPEAWHRDPRLVWEFYSMRRRVAASAAKPNPAHFALAKLEQNWKIACSSAPRMWTTFTSRQDRSASSTCTANSSRAAATGAADRHFVTPTPTILQPSFPGANAAVGFARTSAGSAKCRSSWIASSTHWTNARSSWLLAHRAWSSQPRALWRTWVVVPERSMSERKSLRTHPRSPNAIWGKRGRCCRNCLAHLAHDRHCSFAYSALACFRMGMSESALSIGEGNPLSSASALDNAC